MRARRAARRTRGAATPLRGRIEVPGDKSISHRALILSGLARGKSQVTGINLGEDVRGTAAALQHLGVDYRMDEAKGEVEVQGFGWDGLHEPEAVLDAGNSGTTLRTILGICAGVDGVSCLTGDRSLRHRPMLRVVAPLREMGARIEGRRNGDLAPLWVSGGSLKGAAIQTEVASAQVKTAILLAGLHAAGTTSVTEPGLSRDHTERMLEAAGVAVERDGLTVSVVGGSEVGVVDRRVPGDTSAAMFPLVGALLVPGSELEVSGVGLNPTRTGALEVLSRMGARIEVEGGGESGGEPVGTIRADASELRATRIEGREVTSLIDEIPILAIAATQAAGTTEITGARELRVKESDRIAAIATGLRALGADVEELDDGLRVTGPCRLRGGEVDSSGDHRIAMAFAIAGLISEEKVRIKRWSCVNTSFPEFLDVLAAAQGRK